METATPASRIPVNIEDEVRQSYMDYAMSVIIGRALPDARDGLKPVHRRVLYAMYELGNTWDRPYKKSARVVGDVIGKYHPHGDAAAYETMARMAQDFAMRYPLVDGQGNFGSIDGDKPAAMRYTEVRMARIAGELLADIDRETVDFQPNYDDTLREPAVLPARIPNLLVNGSSGIAVGMSTRIPPHNLGEIVDALRALIDNPALTVDDLMQYVPGPDFPTAGFVHGQAAIAEAYRTGRGSLTLRARTGIETHPRSGRTAIVVRELPYEVNKARLIETIADLVNEKRLEGIADLRDESDRDGMRIVIELKRDAEPDEVLEQLFEHTSLQETFGVQLLAIVEGRPRLLSLKDALTVFLDHRKEVITRRTRHDLRKAEERLHVLEGLRVALDNLDAIIALIRQAREPATAKAELVARFALSPTQAQAILELRLQRLTGLERERILAELAETQDRIAQYHRILGDEREVYALISAELAELKATYGDARRTQIVAELPQADTAARVREETVVVTISHGGYIKRTPVDEYPAQRRGGRGRTAAATKEEDFVEQLFIASTRAALLFFTTSGKVYRIGVHEVPPGSRTSKGRSIANLLALGPEEKISTVLPVATFEPGKYLFFATRAGTVKKTDLMAFARPRRTGLLAIRLDPGDEVVGVRLTDGRQEVILSTREGQAIRFREDDVRPMLRGAAGVRGIALDPGDAVVDVAVPEPGCTILTVSENGYGKRTALGEYRLTQRAGKGVITLQTTDKTGKVVGVRMVRDDADVVLVTNAGKLIRTSVADIPVLGRNTQGVRLMGLGEGERVMAIAPLAERDGGDEAAEGGAA